MDEEGNRRLFVPSCFVDGERKGAKDDPPHFIAVHLVCGRPSHRQRPRATYEKRI